MPPNASWFDSVDNDHTSPGRGNTCGGISGQESSQTSPIETDTHDGEAEPHCPPPRGNYYRPPRIREPKPPVPRAPRTIIRPYKVKWISPAAATNHENIERAENLELGQDNFESALSSSCSQTAPSSYKFIPCDGVTPPLPLSAVLLNLPQWPLTTTTRAVKLSNPVTSSYEDLAASYNANTTMIEADYTSGSGSSRSPSGDSLTLWNPTISRGVGDLDTTDGSLFCDAIEEAGLEDHPMDLDLVPAYDDLELEHFEEEPNTRTSGNDEENQLALETLVPVEVEFPFTEDDLENLDKMLPQFPSFVVSGWKPHPHSSAA
ncbi:hypothetical protein BDN72DRAFT_965611 [Pluteus cervinus]|uniref:Uncharacterized protein n=1 Tax=Pluteus cervinus TaxID=181527 RepID=A0ACD3A4Q5_9AGAR|nr:hypothetical protein BDN72DRAFT_965611 [Pluteus cervinus]